MAEDGYDASVTLECGDDIRWNTQGGPLPELGDWMSCEIHSATYEYDSRTGDAILDRDQRVVQIRKDT